MPLSLANVKFIASVVYDALIAENVIIMGKYRTDNGTVPSGISILLSLKTRFKTTKKIIGKERVKKAAGGFLQNTFLS